MEKPTVYLRCNDDKVYEVLTGAVLKSQTIVKKLKAPDYDGKPIYLSRVDHTNLERILDYLSHYKNMKPKDVLWPFPEKTDDAFFRSILNDEWTYDFVQRMSIEEIVELINVADFMKISGLVNLLSMKLAYEMCNCTVEEAKKKFQIECDMTPKEKAEFDKYPLD